jgi:hypothetical protein
VLHDVRARSARGRHGDVRRAGGAGEPRGRARARHRRGPRRRGRDCGRARPADRPADSPPGAEHWRRVLPLPLATFVYGVLLGLGFTTFVYAVALWALACISFVVASPATGALVGIAFGAGRALPICLLARSQTAAQVAASSTRWRSARSYSLSCAVSQPRASSSSRPPRWSATRAARRDWGPAAIRACPARRSSGRLRAAASRVTKAPPRRGACRPMPRSAAR